MLGDPFRRDSRFPISTEPPLLSRFPWQAPLLQPQAGRIVDDDTSGGNFSNQTPGIFSEYERGLQNSVSHGTSSSVPLELSHVNPMKAEEVATSPFAYSISLQFPFYNISLMSNF